MSAAAFHGLRAKLNTAFAYAARSIGSFVGAPLNAAAPRRPIVGQGRTGFLILAAIAIIFALVVIGLPGWFGGRAEKTYREALRQTAGNGVGIKLDSYQRGWFSSRAVITVPLGSHSVALNQNIHHGPLVFYNGWHVAFPVSAVVETDPPPLLRDSLDRAMGSAPLLIDTVVAMNGTLDTHVSRAASERSVPGLTVRFRGFNLYWYLSPEVHRISGQAPGITATGGFGEAEVANISLRGESHRQSTELWLGSGKLDVQRVSYSLVAHGKHPASSGLIRDLSVSARTALDKGRIDLRLRLGAGEVSGRKLKLGPIVIEEHLNHLAPKPFDQFRKDTAAISRSPADKAARMRMLRALERNFLIAIVKQAPTLAINFSAAGTGGKAVGKMRLVIAKDFASDPLIKDETAKGKALVARAWRKYVDATADVSVPTALLAQFASSAQINGVQAKGILVRNGANYTCHASYRKGEWTVNGKKVSPCGDLRPAARQRCSTHDASSLIGF